MVRSKLQIISIPARNHEYILYSKGILHVDPSTTGPE